MGCITHYEFGLCLESFQGEVCPSVGLNLSSWDVSQVTSMICTLHVEMGVHPRDGVVTDIEFIYFQTHSVVLGHHSSQLLMGGTHLQLLQCLAW